MILSFFTILVSTLTGPFSRSLPTAHLSGILRPSPTTQSLNPSAIQKANENRDPVRTGVAVRKPRARNDRIAIRNRAILLPRHGKRAANRNARKATPTANQSESEKNLNPVTTAVRRTKKGIIRGNTKNGSLGQSRKNRKERSNPRTIPPLLLPTLVPNLMEARSAKNPEVPPGQD